MEKTLEAVREIVKSAPISRPAKISEKGKANFVTDVDQRVDAYLKKKFRNLNPNYGFLTEESETENAKHFIWVIDPIDGTTNFLNGLSYAISVALYDKDTNEALLGVVYDPDTKTEYFASKGEGAYRFQNGKLQRLPERPPQDFARSVAILATSYDRGVIPAIFDKATRLIMQCADIRAIGPAALDICKVAERKASLYFAKTLKPWDYAAGYLILKEAGGLFVEIDGWQLFVQNENTLNEIADIF